MEDFNHNISEIQSVIAGIVKEVNEIYKASIFRYTPNERIYFTIGKWVRLKEFARHPDNPEKPCENHGIVLSEFSHVNELYLTNQKLKLNYISLKFSTF